MPRVSWHAHVLFWTWWEAWGGTGWVIIVIGGSSYVLSVCTVPCAYSSSATDTMLSNGVNRAVIHNRCRRAYEAFTEVPASYSYLRLSVLLLFLLQMGLGGGFFFFSLLFFLFFQYNRLGLNQNKKRQGKGRSYDNAMRQKGQPAARPETDQGLRFVSACRGGLQPRVQNRMILSYLTHTTIIW